jgi:hypothetical protein
MQPKIISFALVIAFWFLSVVRGQDALPSRTAPARKSNRRFRRACNKARLADFVKTEERIATFDKRLHAMC